MKHSFFAFCAGLLLISASAQAATINLQRSEASVGISYIMGFGAFVDRDEDQRVTDGQEPAIAGFEKFVAGRSTGGDSSIGIEMRTSASVAFTSGTGGMAATLFGTWTAFHRFFDVTNVGVGQAASNADVNYILYEFEVLDSPVQYNVSLNSDALSLLKLAEVGGNTVINVAPGDDRSGILQPGRYALDTFFSLATPAPVGHPLGAEEIRSRSGSFGITFLDPNSTGTPGSGVTISDGRVGFSAPVPLPASAWLLAAAMALLVRMKRRALTA